MKLYTKQQLEIIKVIKKDNTDRTPLDGVHFDGDTALVTNGHLLYSLENLNPIQAGNWQANSVKWEKNPKPVTIPRGDIETALKMTPKPDKSNPEIVNQYAIGENSGEELGDSTIQLFGGNNIKSYNPGRFPDYKRVLPDKSLYTLKVGVDPDYLIRIATQMKKLDSLVIMSFKPDSKTGDIQNNPVFFEAQDSDRTLKAEAVIMPKRI